MTCESTVMTSEAIDIPRPSNMHILTVHRHWACRVSRKACTGRSCTCNARADYARTGLKSSHTCPPAEPHDAMQLYKQAGQSSAATDSCQVSNFQRAFKCFVPLGSNLEIKHAI
mmetsp:Transcript_114825/g.288577  ORF Transcript_114825/g.288577 Transcript_114825/m.288577 type:complete len:114 (+) Transcript_114825:3-344(+)